jgi:hypothetical protein
MHERREVRARGCQGSLEAALCPSILVQWLAYHPVVTRNSAWSISSAGWDAMHSRIMVLDEWVHLGPRRLGRSPNPIIHDLLTPQEQGHTVEAHRKLSFPQINSS